MASTTSFRTCPLCEATCGLAIEVENGAVTRIHGDRDDVFSSGFLCPKGTSLGKFHVDPDRLRQPVIKRDGVHIQATWKQAYAEISERLLPVLEASGRDGAAMYLGNPVVHSLDLLLYSKAVTIALGSRKVFSASTVDQRPRELASALIYGFSGTIPVPDLDRSDALMILGANPMVSNGSLATAPDWPGRIEALVSRGGRLIVVDPARTKTAEAATTHLAPIPGTDILLLAAMTTELVTTNRHRPVAEDRLTLESVADALSAFTPETVAKATGLSATSIRRVVDELVASERPCVYGRLGTTITPFGTTTSWLVDVVNALLGSLDSPGGAMFPKSAGGSRNTRGQGPIGRPQSLGRRTTAVSSLPIELGEHPVAALAEEIESKNVTAMITIAGNPVLSCPDSDRLDAAFETLDYMVSVDCYLNETTRHADVILPPPSHLQKPHFDLAFAALSIRNVANYSASILPLDDDGVAEWEVLARLAAVLGGADGRREDAETVDGMLFEELVQGALSAPGRPTAVDAATIGEAVSTFSGPERLLDVIVRSGPFGDWFGEGEGLSVAKLLDHPHGIDLGPLEPRLPEALLTPSGRPEFNHPDLMADIERIETLLDVDDDPSVLRLINRRTLRSNNSWMHNLEVLVKGKLRCTMQMHPADAQRHGLQAGGRARVTSSVGAIEIQVDVDDALREGVVSIPHGWGHGVPGTAMSVAGRHRGVNVNVLTPSGLIDPLSGTSQLTGIAVTVEAIAG
ncbi:MAG: anaerobic selenocysteine-containing dehydrogenase [Verrucomicrobiales bacterium]|jgi:anaerobic selenocysteine-containing dehydrogenase